MKKAAKVTLGCSLITELIFGILLIPAGLLMIQLNGTAQYTTDGLFLSILIEGVKVIIPGLFKVFIIIALLVGLKTNEKVYELDGKGNVAKYEKNAFMESFRQDKTISTETLAQEKDDMLVLLQTLGFCFVDANSGVQFKKCENQKAVLTGDVYVYEMLQDGESLGEVWVDQETGVFVKWTDKNGEEAFSVQEIKTSDIDIPEYK